MSFLGMLDSSMLEFLTGSVAILLVSEANSLCSKRRQLGLSMTTSSNTRARNTDKRKDLDAGVTIYHISRSLVRPPSSNHSLKPVTHVDHSSIANVNAKLLEKGLIRSRVFGTNEQGGILIRIFGSLLHYGIVSATWLLLTQTGEPATGGPSVPILGGRKCRITQQDRGGLNTTGH